MTIWVVFKAIIEISIVAILGVLAFHFGWLSREDTKHLGALTVNLTYPLLIFVNITKKFSQASSTPYWYLLPLANILVMFGGVIIAYIFLKINKKITYKREFIMLSAFQNGAYLPLVVVSSLFSPEKASLFFVYIFLFCMFYGPIIISTTKFFFAPEKKDGIGIKTFLSMPIIALTIALLFVFLHFNNYMPKVLMNAFERVGNITIPIILFTLGGILYYSFENKRPIDYSHALWASFLKLIIIPTIFLIIAILIPMPGYLKFMLIMEGASPVAISVSVYIRFYGGNDVIASQSAFIMYMLSLITFPFFVMLAIKISGI